jgi:hypothetical protein
MHRKNAQLAESESIKQIIITSLAAENVGA